MKYTLTNKDILQLALLIPVSKFNEYVGDYCPSRTTIYRTFESIGETPTKWRRNYKKTIIQACPNEDNYEIRLNKWENIRTKHLEELVTNIQAKAERHGEIYS